MKTLQKLTYFTIAATALTFAGFANAEEKDLHFDHNGYFYCTVSDADAVISMDTDHLNGNGFCNGDEYVTGAGHIANMPAKVFNTYAFDVHITTDPHPHVMHVNVSSGTLECTTYSDAGRPHWGSGCYGEYPMK